VFTKDKTAILNQLIDWDERVRALKAAHAVPRPVSIKKQTKRSPFELAEEANIMQSLKRQYAICPNSPFFLLPNLKV